MPLDSKHYKIKVGKVLTPFTLEIAADEKKPVLITAAKILRSDNSPNSELQITDITHPFEKDRITVVHGAVYVDDSELAQQHIEKAWQGAIDRAYNAHINQRNTYAELKDDANNKSLRTEYEKEFEDYHSKLKAIEANYTLPSLTISEARAEELLPTAKSKLEPSSNKPAASAVIV